MRAWAHGVRAYNRAIDDLNAEWSQAKAADFGIDALELDRASMTSADIESAVVDHAVEVSGARSALMARLVARRSEAEGRLDRVADGARVMLDHSDDPNIQTLAAYTGAVGVTAVADLFGDDHGAEYPDSVMQGDPNAYWSTPEARAAQMREDELDNYEGADLGWSDVGEALAFLFGDPRQCVGDDASPTGCGIEVAGIFPGAKLLKVLKFFKRLDKAGETADDAHDARRAGDSAADAGQATEELSQTAESIANGHAYEKHIDEFRELGIESQEELAEHVRNVVNDPSEYRELERGRSAYWDADTETLVILGPNHPDGGTVFRPDDGYDYVQDDLD